MTFACSLKVNDTRNLLDFFFLLELFLSNQPTPFETRHLCIPVSALRQRKEGVIFTDEYAIAWTILWNFTVPCKFSIPSVYSDFSTMVMRLYIYIYIYIYTPHCEVEEVWENEGK